MLEVQLCRRSKGGVVIPIARDHAPELVRMVVRYFYRQLEKRSFGDEVLNDTARLLHEAFVQAVEHEGYPVRDLTGREK